MSIDDTDFRAEVIGVIDLIELDTTEGICRFILGQDGWFKDVNGNIWVGSKLTACSEIEFSINGTAPGTELTFSFIQDPEEEDLIAQVKAMGVAAVQGRDARFYIQTLETTSEFFRPVAAPQLLTTRVMQNIGYAFEGPQIRRLSLTVEGAFNLRSKAVGGRYNTADHSRRCGHPNPSLEFMPTNNSDEQSLFGL
ncbi:hypothetical protein [Oryzicola mucosus]|uniref:Uncharacterized protein n=1 Tax=Oryzicola mucosus TaxID=2767425 RepID=A0A8J6U5L9_9HYPH|nr:hypothetical protein [Oryzicola mucosus]MBD0416500.1 hypothetical protein [Oryzicola mucosus]